MKKGKIRQGRTEKGEEGGLFHTWESYNFKGEWVPSEKGIETIVYILKLKFRNLKDLRTYLRGPKYENSCQNFIKIH